jgi:hypothetical protein
MQKKVTESIQYLVFCFFSVGKNFPGFCFEIRRWIFVCRWYTYLNSDFKRGGWSPEEDMLLCEAQRVFGNRWTEIAKVVSGRYSSSSNSKGVGEVIIIRPEWLN